MFTINDASILRVPIDRSLSSSANRPPIEAPPLYLDSADGGGLSNIIFERSVIRSPHLCPIHQLTFGHPAKHQSQMPLPLQMKDFHLPLLC